MKKKILFCGITMNCAGTEKAFLSLLDTLDFDRYDVDLLLAVKDGPLLSQIPEQVNVLGSMDQGALFQMSGRNAAKTISKTVLKKHPLKIFTVLPYFLKIIFNKKKKADTATRLWCRLLRDMPDFQTEFGIDREYDAAIAFWGDRTMFYMVDKVKAKKKIAWLHFDYAHPAREDELYLSYFRRCDYIVNVSQACHEALVNKLPEIAGKCVVMENIRSPKQIRELALRGETFPDKGYKGVRVVSVMRICAQKGSDFIVPVLKRLLDEGFELRWYVIGGGDPEDVDKLKMAALDACVADRLMILGEKTNPYRFIRDADIFALPSRFEGRPITVEEAKMLYTPIAVTDYLSASEQLEDGNLGMIGGDGENGIYKALKKLITDKELCAIYSGRLMERDFGNTGEIQKLYRMIDGEM